MKVLIEWDANKNCIKKQVLNNALGRIENAVPRPRGFSLCFLKENPVKCRSGPATVRKSKAAWMNIRSLGSNLWEGAAARGFRARRTACFVRPADPREMGRGADYDIGMIQRLSSWRKLFLLWKSKKSSLKGADGLANFHEGRRIISTN